MKDKNSSANTMHRSSETAWLAQYRPTLAEGALHDLRSITRGAAYGFNLPRTDDQIVTFVRYWKLLF